MHVSTMKGLRGGFERVKSSFWKATYSRRASLERSSGGRGQALRYLLPQELVRQGEEIKTVARPSQATGSLNAV